MGAEYKRIRTYVPQNKLLARRQNSAHTSSLVIDDKTAMMSLVLLCSVDLYVVKGASSVIRRRAIIGAFARINCSQFRDPRRTQSIHLLLTSTAYL